MEVVCEVTLRPLRLPKKISVVSHLESGSRVAVVPVPGAHAGLALHEVGDHLKLLEMDSIGK